MLKEIGGYFELERFYGKEYYPDALAVNCGRNAAVLVAKLRGYKRVYLPDFLCSSVGEALMQNSIDIQIYNIGNDLRPIFNNDLHNDEAIYIVNYYGQLRDDIDKFKCKWKNIIWDNAQDFFFRPSDIDSVYTCRKYFGVTDGGYVLFNGENDFLQEYNLLEQDESFERLRYAAGRFERSASEFYSMSVENNKLFENESVKRMSQLTHNFLRAIDYKRVKGIRTENFTALHDKLKTCNLFCDLFVPDGAFMYPFRINNGAKLRKHLQEHKIFVPKLWPDVCDSGCAAELADSIVPIPCDQRYDIKDMNYIVDHIFKYLENEVY